MTENETNICRCECGSVTFQVPTKPLFRMFCHCTICQKFNNADYADIYVYRAADVCQPEEGLVRFDTYRPPPNVQRGKCASCDKPAIEVLSSPILPNLILVPGNMQSNSNALPTPKGHVFYESRIKDVDDHLPKHLGYLKSQLVFGKHLMKGLFARD